MSINAEFEAEVSSDHDSPFSKAPGGNPFGGFAGEAGGNPFRDSPGAQQRKSPSGGSKPNFVVRAWRVVKDFFVGIGRAVFSRQFWVDFIATALRDALAALGYSIGMRMVKKAAATGDIIFRDKSGMVFETEAAAQGTAYASQQSWPPRAKPSGSSVQDNLMAYPADRPYAQRSFVN